MFIHRSIHAVVHRHPAGIDGETASPLVELELIAFDAVHPTDLGQVVHGGGYRTGRDAEHVSDPGTLDAAIQPMGAVLLVPKETADQHGDHGEHDSPAETSGQGTERSPWHGDGSFPVWDFLVHGPKTRNVIECDLINRDCQLDLAFGEGNEANPGQVFEVSGDPGALPPYQVHKLIGQVARFAALCGVPATFPHLVEGEADTPLPAADVPFCEQPDHQDQLMGGELEKPALNGSVADADRRFDRSAGWFRGFGECGGHVADSLPRRHTNTVRRRVYA